MVVHCYCSMVMSGCVVVAGGDEWCYPVEVAPGAVPE